MKMALRLFLFASICLFGVLARAATPEDPWEKQNRTAFNTFNSIAKVSFWPLGTIYHTLIPHPVRKSTSNFFSNLNEIPTGFWSLTTGNTTVASHAFGRFVINSTLGVGGLFDPATKLDLQKKSFGAGDTLAFYFPKHRGPFIMLGPIPTDVRGLLGIGLDLVVFAFITNPEHLDLDPNNFKKGGANYLEDLLNLSDSQGAVLSGISSTSEIIDPLLVYKKIPEQVDAYALVRDAYLHQNGAVQAPASPSSAPGDPFNQP